MKKFEDCISEIDAELKKQRSKWNVSFLTHFDYDDVAQIVRIHLHKKWSSWDQSRPFASWCSTVISNQIKNLIRNNYASFAKPCVRCPFSQGDGFSEGEGLCAITTNGTQCSECPLFARWEKSKKDAYNVKVPLSIEGSSHSSVADTIFAPSGELDFEKAFADLNSKIKERLKNQKLYRAYEMLFVEKHTDEEVAKFMGYKSTEANRAAGYKQIRNLKARFKELAKDILDKKDIFI